MTLGDWSTDVCSPFLAPVPGNSVQFIGTTTIANKMDIPYMIVSGGSTVTGAVRSKSATVNGSFQKSDGTTVPAGQFQPGNGSEFDLITNSGSLKPAEIGRASCRERV